MKDGMTQSMRDQAIGQMPGDLRERIARAAVRGGLGERAGSSDEAEAAIGAEAELFGRLRAYRPGAVAFVDLSSPGSSGWGALVLAVVLTLVVGGMTWFTTGILMKQHAVGDWKPVPARIEMSQVEVTRRSGRRNRTSHVFKVQYSYEVDGTRHTSNVVDMASESIRSKAYAPAKRDEFPAGKSVTAFVNPADARQAVLQNQLLAQHGIFLIFVIPIIPWIFKFLLSGYQSAIARVWSQEAAGLPTADDGTNLSITLPRHGVVNFAMNVWFGLLLAMTIYFVIFSVIMYSDMSLMMMLGLYGATIPVAILAAAMKLSTIRSGSKDLVINRITREVMLPATFGRAPGVIVPIDAIRAVQTSDVMSRTKHGKEYRSATKLELLADEGEHTLAVWSDARRADGFGAYLAEVLSGVKAGPGVGGRRVMPPRKIV